MARPLPFRWTGEAMEPIRGFARVADREYVVGEVYTLAETQDRSQASHRHYFAAVYEAWLNLPEDMAERFPSADHLRKYALVRAGYRDERTITCASKAEALRVGAFVKPMDEFAVVAVSEAVVRVYTAKSQSVKAMGRKVFQESKDGVLGCLAQMIGVEVGVLSSHGRDAGGGESRRANSHPAAAA